MRRENLVGKTNDGTASLVRSSKWKFTCGRYVEKLTYLKKKISRKKYKEKIKYVEKSGR